MTAFGYTIAFILGFLTCAIALFVVAVIVFGEKREK